MTSGPTIDYEALQQDAMRGVVKAVLAETAKSGLPGDHHFYVSFNTRAPGVSLSRRLKEKYPQEMTIVLQHRFWGLTVFEERFEVNLTFDGIPERLVVPFQAIRVFVDPSVRFGLQFEVAEIGPEPEIATAAAGEANDPRGSSRGEGSAAAQGGKATTPRRPRPARKPRADRADRSTERDAASSGERGDAETPATAPSAADKPDEAVPAAAAAGAPANVVSLDAFRKR
ncbi:MAG: SspB family protein [Hyphomicrobiaceae bacterium]